jgi:hypothetical protein
VTAATTNSANLSRPKRVAGVALFLVVTACWVFGLAAWEEGWIDVSDLAFVGAAGLSAVSVVLTGYLGVRTHSGWGGFRGRRCWQWDLRCPLRQAVMKPAAG